MPRKSTFPTKGTRLEPLRVIAKIADVPNQDLIAATGKTTMALYKAFRDDDIKLSSLSQMAERCGYSVYAALSKSSIPDRDLFTPVTASHPIDFIMRSLQYYGYTRESAAEKAGINLSTFNGWIYRQKCSLADIIELGRKLDMTMHMEYRRIESVNEAPKGGGLFVTIDGLKYYCK